MDERTHETSPGADRRELLKKALQALEEMQAKVRALERARSEPIAIIGMSCRFPGGADTPDAFWRLLRDGVDAIGEVPHGRWRLDRYEELDPEFAATLPALRGGFIDSIDQFDPAFFGISPREAMSMDPQQRLALEGAWEALENAGYDPIALRGTATGVFIGVTATDYFGHLRSADPQHLDVYLATGNTHNGIAGRVSFALGLQGPSMAVDTACSSSLAAIHLACQSLRVGESNLALAGGVNAILNPDSFFAFFKWGMTAVDGRCKTFDESADGFVRAEGCGTIALKRLSDAIADGDRILAVIRGSAINQDGASSGFTVPNGFAQEAVIRQALRVGGVEPSSVSYVEAHGTGTSLGDPIELEALDAVLGPNRPAGRPLVVGSVKTNFGHLESAAGIAGLIKVVLALQHREIPRHLHLTRLNSRASFQSAPPVVPTSIMPWQADGSRIAGVSSFGISGTNTHVVVEEAPAREVVPATVDRSAHLLTLSAKDEKALAAVVSKWRDHAAADDSLSLGDAAYTANTGRSHFAHRLAIVSASVDQLRNQLAALSSGEMPAGVSRGQVRSDDRQAVAFLFPGQGAQAAGMGRTLYATQPTFRRAIERCEAALTGEMDQPLRTVLFPETSADTAFIDQTAYTQPALFAVEYALSELWRTWGVTPTLVLGHSVGEYVAACVAGVFSVEDGLRLIAARGRLMQALPAGGAMAAVWASEAMVRATLAAVGGDVELAAVNGPGQVTIAGPAAAVEAVRAALTTAGVRSQKLRVSHAFHSAQMEPMLDAFTKAAETVRYATPRIGVVSNLTGKRAMAGEVASAAYWRRQLREAVRFGAGLQTLVEQGCTTFVEVGPTLTLLGLGPSMVGGERAAWLPTLRGERQVWETLLGTLGELYVRGVPVDWRGVDADYGRQKVALPTYPFQRQRYWVDPKPTTRRAATAVDAWRDWLYDLEWEKQPRVSERAEPGSTASHWIVLADERGIGERLARVIAARGHRCSIVAKGDSFESNAGGRFIVNPQRREDFDRLVSAAIASDADSCRGVVHLWGVDGALHPETRGEEFDVLLERTCGSALYLSQALLSAGLDVLPQLTLVTRGAQPAGNAAPAAPGAAMVWGLGRAIALEHPELQCKCIDLESADAVLETEIGSLCEIVLADRTAENQIALRGGRSFGLRLVRRSTAPMPVDASPVCRSGRTYLITGGLTGVGLRVAEQLVELGARHLVLMGRRQPAAAALQTIKSIRDRGATVAVVNADVANREAVAELLDRVALQGPPLGGVVHSAGALDDGVLLGQSWEKFQTVMAAKVIGSWHLHELTRSLPLDFFALFSSTASLLGHPGQSNYAAVNAFLDALAHYRRREGLPAISINWGPWKETGLAARTGLLDRASAQGVGGIDPADGLKAFEYLLRTGSAQAAVLPVNWATLMRSFPPGQQPPLLRHFEETSPAAANLAPEPSAPTLLSALAAAPAHLAWGVVLEHVTSEARRVLGLDRAAGVDAQQGLRDLGLDSLMALELRNRLQHSVGQPLRATLALDCPSIEALARHLAVDVLNVLPPTKASEADGGDADDLLMSIEQLSEDEVDRMFASKVQGA